jgi:hypothetical protein
MTPKPKKKKMTLEDLAAMVGEGFLDLEHRLGTRIDQVESSLSIRIDNLESTLNQRIDGIESNLGTRIDLMTYTVKAHMHMSDRHYVELKRRDELIVRKGKLSISESDFRSMAV